MVEIVRFFRTGQPPVAAEETLEILAFMEAADESKRHDWRGGKSGKHDAKGRPAVRQDRRVREANRRENGGLRTELEPLRTLFQFSTGSRNAPFLGFRAPPTLPSTVCKDSQPHFAGWLRNTNTPFLFPTMMSGTPSPLRSLAMTCVLTPESPSILCE